MLVVASYRISESTPIHCPIPKDPDSGGDMNKPKLRKGIIHKFRPLMPSSSRASVASWSAIVSFCRRSLNSISVTRQPTPGAHEPYRRARLALVARSHSGRPGKNGPRISARISARPKKNQQPNRNRTSLKPPWQDSHSYLCAVPFAMTRRGLGVKVPAVNENASGQIDVRPWEGRRYRKGSLLLR